MNELVFATNNAHKLAEVKAILEPEFRIISLNELNCYDDIPETSDTLEGNALIKASYIYEKYNLNCFADDTGLEIESLNGEPGVYSARYAGDNHDAWKNMQKVLSRMEGIENRNARFRTVIALIINGNIRFFEGKIQGKIAKTVSGTAGFGYDPIFVPEGYDLSFAQLSINEKNTISHRALAINKLSEHLEEPF